MSLGCWGLCYRKNIKASAICQYAFSDVQKVFEGPYMEVQDSKWREYTGKVPDPRPGSVSFKALTFSPPSSAIVMFCIFSHFFLSVSSVYNRSAQVPEHQLVSRSPRQCPHLRQKAPADGQTGAPNRCAPPHVQKKCQLCQDSSAQRAGTGWKYLHCSVFGNWWVSYKKSNEMTK